MPSGSKIRPIKLIFTGDISGIAKAVGDVNKHLDRVTKPMRQLGGALRRFDELSGLKKIRTRLVGVGDAVATLARRAFFLSSALGGAGLFAMKRFISGLDSLDEAAQAAGTSVEFLQRGRFAAGRSGVPVELFDASLRKLTKTMGQVRMGQGALTKLRSRDAAALAKQLRGTRSTAEAFTAIARSVGQMNDVAKRNTILDAIFGRGGSRLAPMLKDWDQLVRLADELGIVLSADVVARGVQAQVALENLGLRAKGIAFLVGAELLPVVLDITKRISDWTEKNRDLIRTEVPKFARQLADAIGQAVDLTVIWLPKINSLVESVGGLKTVLVGLSVVVMTRVIAAVYALGAAMLTTPLGWWLIALGGIAAALALIILRWDEWSGKVATSSPALAASGIPSGISMVRGLLGGRDLPERQPLQAVDVGGNIRLEILGANTRVRGMESWGGIDITTLSQGLSMAPGF